MTKKEAMEYLAETVGEYIINGFPLERLTGEESNHYDGTRPDSLHLTTLQHALNSTGLMMCEKAAQVIGLRRIKDA